MRITRAIALLVLASVTLSAASCSTTETDDTTGLATVSQTSVSQSTAFETEEITVSGSESTMPETGLPETEETEAPAMGSLVMKIGSTVVDVTWEDNASVEDLKKLAASGLTIQMSMYGGFEQVGPIGQSIARDDKQTTTEPGDIVLYSGNQIVVFYGSNSWSYTRLGKINLTEKELKDLLSNGDVTVTLSLG